MHPSVYKRPLLWTVIVVIILLSLFYHPAPGKRDVSLFLPQKEVTLTGQVDSFPITRKDKQYVWLRVKSVNQMPTRGRVYARLGSDTLAWKDRVEMSGRLQAPYGISLPGNFDWRAYLARKQTFAEIKTSHVRVVHQAAWIWRWVRRVRKDILRTLNTSFPPQLAGIAGGILLGERGDFSQDLFAAFQDSGAIHLLVASGGNVGFVTLLTLGLGILCGLRRRTLLIFALVTAGIYTLIAGADAPLLRAYLMTVCACVGYLLGRNSGVFQGLLLSCLIILCCTPYAVFDTGFQMSFLATLAIVVCLNNYRVPDKWPKWVRFFIQIFLATLASQLALLPVFTNVFYKVSVTGLLSNMILVPLASLLMGLTFAYYVLASLHIGLVLYYPCLWGLTLFQVIVEFFASFRFSSLPATAWNGGTIVAYYVLLFWISQLPHKAFAKKLFAPCLGVALLSVLVGGWIQNRPRVYLLNEWNHHAAIVRVCRKQAFVFNDGIAADKLHRALLALGVRRADFSTSFEPEDSLPETVSARTEIPFETLWPGDNLIVGKAEIRPVWELRQTQDGRVFEDTGYSGKTGSGLSYCVRAKKREVCVGSHARFVQFQNGQTISYKPNGTVRASW